MRILFEDADGTPVSDLIRTAYDGTGVVLYFVGGAGNFFNVVSALSDDETTLLLLDLIPNNTATSKDYKTLRRKLRNRHNTYIVPTMSLDYMLLKAFTKVDLDVRHLVFDDYSLDARITSAEKYCKYLLDTYSDCISLGRFSDVTEITSMFYKGSCRCRLAGCDEEEYLLPQKAIDLVYSMPFFYGVQISKPVDKFDYDKYTESYIRLHNDLVRELYNSGRFSLDEYNRGLISL